MIAFIKGILEYVGEHSVILENNGIGYELQIAAATLSKLPAKGQPVKLFTSLSVKEDSLMLYGFISQEELDMYHLLVTVSGVGPKAAMGILSVMNPSQIMLSILSDDVSALGKAPGVGKKTAQRLCLELKDKMGAARTIVEPQQTLSMTGGGRQDAIDALCTLGYTRNEALRAVMEVALDGMGTEQIIKLALKRLTKL